VLVLGIDTSDGVSVALVDGSGALEDAPVLARADGADPRRHAETLAPAIAWVLAEAGVTAKAIGAVAVGTGPAPFTGLRVGLVTARSLARVLDIPAYGICSLDALARQAFVGFDADGPLEVLVATDARRREVYTAAYVRSPAGSADVARVSDPAVTTAADLRAQADERYGGAGRAFVDALATGEIAVVGRGAHLYADLLPPTAGGPQAVDAAALARLALQRAAAGGETDLEPRYLRRPDISPPAPRKRAS
jgi:tRNA threonylcarbamoyladenosine biosynthesis protein TsaB